MKIDGDIRKYSLKKHAKRVQTNFCFLDFFKRLAQELSIFRFNLVLSLEYETSKFFSSKVLFVTLY